MQKDRNLIPVGPYCYDKYGRCPYWRHRSTVDKVEVGDQDYGYCLFLELGDVEINKQERRSDQTGNISSADELGLPLSLLWDQCKECGINDDWEDEEE